MSYCRWSSDNFKSAVYVYESSEGYMIHVAASKYPIDCPYPDPMMTIGKPDLNSEEWLKEYKRCREWFDSQTLIPIGLPFDGQTYCEDTAKDASVRLHILKVTGYHIPDGVIEELAAEEDEDA